jgi:hypothetical protein
VRGLSDVAFFGGAGKFHPILRKPQPRYFIGGTDRDCCLSDAFFGLAEVPLQIACGLATHLRSYLIWLFGRLQAGRSESFGHMGRGFGLPGAAH